MQNIRLLYAHNQLTNFSAKCSATNDTKSNQSFMSILNNSISSPNTKSSAKTQLSDDNENETLRKISEDGPRYCSLCGSQIDEKGNCPICIIPLCISGDQLNKQAQNQSVSDSQSAQHVSSVQDDSSMNLMLGINVTKMKNKINH